ncbi:MAG: hypothetical protein RQ752_12800, partial [Thermohalobaculum sp.]|nr:hypothetical protein [Thermohalobaculum sp.]
AEGCLRGRAGGPGDAAVLLGVLLQPPGAATFGPADPRVLASILWLCDWSAAAFPVNAGGAPAIGRGPGDRFFGGNPWLPTTLGMAEIHFALAGDVLDRGGLARSPQAERFLARLGAVVDTGALARGLIGRGEAFLATVRRHAPGDGRLPEQIDRASGAPTSCPDLTWSHAALLAALDAREAARRRLQAES